MIALELLFLQHVWQYITCVMQLAFSSICICGCVCATGFLLFMYVFIYLLALNFIVIMRGAIGPCYEDIRHYEDPFICMYKCGLRKEALNNIICNG